MIANMKERFSGRDREYGIKELKTGVIRIAETQAADNERLCVVEETQAAVNGRLCALEEAVLLIKDQQMAHQQTGGASSAPIRQVTNRDIECKCYYLEDKQRYFINTLSPCIRIWLDRVDALRTSTSNC